MVVSASKARSSEASPARGTSPRGLYEHSHAKASTERIQGHRWDIIKLDLQPNFSGKDSHLRTATRTVNSSCSAWTHNEPCLALHVRPSQVISGVRPAHNVQAGLLWVAASLIYAWFHTCLAFYIYLAVAGAPSSVKPLSFASFTTSENLTPGLNAQMCWKMARAVRDAVHRGSKHRVQLGSWKDLLPSTPPGQRPVDLQGSCFHVLKM